VIPDIKKAFQELSAVSLKGFTENQKNVLYSMLVIIESNLYNN